MRDRYRVLYRGGEGETVEKKSRFIATIRPVESEEEAAAFIAMMKKQYWDASHNCSAFTVGENNDAATTANRPRRRGGRCWMCFWEKKSITSAPL